MKILVRLTVRLTTGLLLLLPLSLASAAATVLYGARLVELESTLADPNDLWIRPVDLPRVNDFVLKPEGACLDDVCVPVRQQEDSDIYLTRGGEGWFNLAELADRLRQPYVADHEAAVWSFGAIPVTRASVLRDSRAPDFSLPDVNGRHYALSDFKGRKIMLLTWASW